MHIYIEKRLLGPFSTIVSAKLKLTMKQFVTLLILLWAKTIQMTIKFPPVATTTIRPNRMHQKSCMYHGRMNLLTSSVVERIAVPLSITNPSSVELDPLCFRKKISSSFLSISMMTDANRFKHWQHWSSVFLSAVLNQKREPSITVILEIDNDKLDLSSVI